MNEDEAAKVKHDLDYINARIRFALASTAYRSDKIKRRQCTHWFKIRRKLKQSLVALGRGGLSAEDRREAIEMIKFISQRQGTPMPTGFDLELSCLAYDELKNKIDGEIISDLAERRAK